LLSFSNLKSRQLITMPGPDGRSFPSDRTRARSWTPKIQHAVTLKA
jgi:hypothetical protein